MRCHRRSKAELRSRVVARTFVAVLMAAAPWPPATALAASRNPTLPGNKDLILQISAGLYVDNLAVHTALLGAYRRFASPECRKVLSDFTDRSGLALQENLNATGETAQDYLGQLSYANGRDRGLCKRGDIAAFTTVGGRIVYICPRFTKMFLTMRPGEREDMEIDVIHEVLHTLGLGENPPSSEEITKRVRGRCGDR